MIERNKPYFDKLGNTEDVKEMVGYYYPSEVEEWEVVLEYEGEGHTVHNQFEAEVVSHNAMIRWLILKGMIGGR
jgi:hypothetical protein